MTVLNKKEPFMLGFGDLFLLTFSLMGALILRSQSIPTLNFVQAHVFPFIIIFLYSILTFYISGLYGRTVTFAKTSIPSVVIKAQIFNGLIAVLLFYFIPSFSVTPKTTLFIYIVLSSLFIILWRINSYSIFSFRKRQPVLIIGNTKEADEIQEEINKNSRYLLFCKEKIDITKENAISSLDKYDKDFFRYIIADLDDPKIESFLPELYKRFFPHSSIINIYDLYEDIFDKIPLSRINYTWIMSHVSSISPKIYDIGKRLLDIFLAFFVAIFALMFYPFVALAIKLEDGGPVFIKQVRIGKNNKMFNIYKYRSMTRSDNGQWLPESVNKVTKVGMFIRKTRIDELPQALSVLKGDMSLIGPRSDIIDLFNRLEKEIPYYSIRTVIKPGLSGWAQVNQEKPPQSVEETRVRLSYDLYYVKHRSLSLDLLIALRTIKTLLSREGM